MSKISRNQKIEKLLLLHRENGQVLYKSIQAALSQQVAESLSTVILLRTLQVTGPMTQREVAQTLCHSEAAISRQVSLAAEKHYISTTTGQDDNRTSVISLTTTGSTLATNASKIIANHCQQLLHGLSDDILDQAIQANLEFQKTITQNQMENNA